ncbi:MFS general substrate transporter [Annulohypoxylon maeteangense]|uniref:MFS general substrate transporter n=1 Tax=Annulohypoxylon maeteangense TaxID=1927788 RepID=UPI0020073C24|nr:MFS general substrate transporter [Annulohypoxylon maeteangense]KAI0885900.1 MFS general substrate transporter [Annulohypoxylon maeteangense]
MTAHRGSEDLPPKPDLDSQFQQVEIATDPEDADFKRREARVVAKLDLYVCPILIILQLISFLDRGNIGFAATQGMITDLHLVGTQLNTAISLFYPLYILSEFPAALIVKRIGFHRLIPAAAACWGLACLGNGFAKSFGDLAACRLLMGMFEGFLMPSLTLMLANWYKREEIGLRISYLFIASSVSSAFSGVIAYAILFMDGKAGYPGWRWLYIIEGSVTVVVAAACYFIIPSSYTTAYFLNEDDRAVMRKRAELTEAYSGGKGHYTRAEFMMAIKDVKTWLHTLIQVMCLTVMYGFSVFLPIILRFGFNFSVEQSQYLSIPVFFWGSLVYAVVGYLSDRFSRRFIACVLCAPFGVIGYAILLGGEHLSVGVKYFACFIIATCVWVMGGANIAWLSTNSAPDGKRAASLGFALAIGNLGGIISGQIYPQTMAPAYTLGHAWSLGAICVAFSTWMVIRHIYYNRESLKNDVRGTRSSEPIEFSDRAPSYKYQH